jgi:lipopolysaccharide transport system ATP-binding protein
VQAYGDVFDVTQDYLAYHERKMVRESGPELESTYDGAEYRVVALSLNGSEDTTAQALVPGEPLRIEARVFTPDGRHPQFGFGLIRADGTPVYGTSTEIDGVSGQPAGEHHWVFRCVIDTAALLPGGYALKLHVLDPEGMRLFDTVDRGLVVRGASRELGLVRLPHQWGGASW